MSGLAIAGILALTTGLIAAPSEHPVTTGS